MQKATIFATILTLLLVSAAASALPYSVSYYSASATLFVSPDEVVLSIKVLCVRFVSSSPEPTSHRLLTAILLPEGSPTFVDVEALDSEGAPLRINGVLVEFFQSSEALARVNELHPPPAGTSWIAYSSGEPIPALAEPEQNDFLIQYRLDHDTDPESARVAWVSNDADTRNGELVFGSGAVAEVFDFLFIDGLESGDTNRWGDAVP